MKYLFCVFLIALAGCQTDLSTLPPYTNTKQLQMVVTTPAGASYQNHFNPETKAFEKVQEAGQEKIIRFLPWPVNAGFIPSTNQPKGPGSEGEPLPVLLLSGSQEPGMVIEITPLAVLILETAGEINYQLVATPAKPSERLIEATSFDEFSLQNQPVKKVLETWFVNQNPRVKTRIMGWKDERFAEELVRRWMK